MIKKAKRIIAGTLAVITLMTAIPMTFVNAASDGEKRSASIESLEKVIHYTLQNCTHKPDYDEKVHII